MSMQGALIDTWRQAELFAAAHMRTLGFHDADVTNTGSDGGLDVLASGGFAQVKHHAQAVGSPAVQNLLGAGKGLVGKAIFYSLSGYTKKALEFSETTNVALFSYTTDGQVFANSTQSALLLRRGFVHTPQGVIGLASQEWVTDTRKYVQWTVNSAMEILAKTGDLDPFKFAESQDAEAVKEQKRMLQEIVDQVKSMRGHREWEMQEMIGKTIRLDRLLQQFCASNDIDLYSIEKRSRPKL